jgi:hypothetical protein
MIADLGNHVPLLQASSLCWGAGANFAHISPMPHTWGVPGRIGHAYTQGGPRFPPQQALQPNSVEADNELSVNLGDWHALLARPLHHVYPGLAVNRYVLFDEWDVPSGKKLFHHAAIGSGWRGIDSNGHSIIPQVESTVVPPLSVVEQMLGLLNPQAERAKDAESALKLSVLQDALLF